MYGERGEDIDVDGGAVKPVGERRDISELGAVVLIGRETRAPDGSGVASWWEWR